MIKNHKGNSNFYYRVPLDNLREARIEKLKKLQKMGDAYPAKSWRSHVVVQALENFDKYAEDKDRLVLVGRVMAKREHGGSMFLDIEDSTGRIQIYLKQDVIGGKDYQYFNEVIDMGDFVEVGGFLFKTKKEEKTLEVEKYRILVKSLRPLPEKWHGLTNVEERFRKRYLDFLSNSETRQKIITRAKIIQSLRDFLNRHDLIEVATPVLQPLYGGASARPFKTHSNTLAADLFLRIAPELYLKRLLVGGFDRVFEFTTNFRNEGIDRDHNPEFTALEFYVAYKDLEWLMDFTESMFENLLEAVFGSKIVKYESLEIDFNKSYKRVTFNELFSKYAAINYELATDNDLRQKAIDLELKIEKDADKAGLADEIFKKAIRPHLIDPTFVIEWPVEILPLAKRLPDKPEYVGAFQFFVGGMELIKAFQELNNPLDQAERFKTQEHKRAKGDEEAQRLDEDYIEALEYGMPPAAGLGLGIDRLVALLTNSHSIREVILFPLMRPRSKEE